MGFFGSFMNLFAFSCHFHGFSGFFGVKPSPSGLQINGIFHLVVHCSCVQTVWMPWQPKKKGLNPLRPLRTICTRWWFDTDFLCSPQMFGEDEPNLTHNFSDGVGLTTNQDNIACWCRLWCCNYWCLRCRWKCSGDIFKRWTFFRGGDLDDLVCPTLDGCCIQEKYALDIWRSILFFIEDFFLDAGFLLSSAFHTLMEPGNGPLEEEIP